MKTAIYIEDGTVQLVLTPQNEFEKNALASFEGKPTTTRIVIGSFYDCRGGWVRQQRVPEHFRNPNIGYSLDEMKDDRSLILRVDTAQNTEPSGR